MDQGDNMPDGSSSSAPTRDPAQLKLTIGLIAGIWIASDIGYYFLLPALGEKSDYNDGPIATALYYFFWTGIGIIAFWPQYASWPLYARWATFENRLTSIIVWSLAFAVSVMFAAYLLPALPPFDPHEGINPPELPLATPWYFLPKSIEILFQQLLVVALVLTLSAENCSLRKISLCCATLFGSAHVLLAFGDVSWGYVARFSILAAAFGLAFPYLILRVPNGFAYSYVTHWGYYAVTVVMARTLGPGAIPDLVKGLLGWS
ncbi:hypothetical protein [Chelativorans xinjiangense]|uniref:hypothetical protein n=1 Tax=Chelativorans xinjiangense TaxID=2681485 RepID=UPI00135B3FE8|nr:hypothetical protein [Chelativorans xinjiangense]